MNHSALSLITYSDSHLQTWRSREDIPLTVPCESWECGLLGHPKEPRGCKRSMTTATMQCWSKRRAWERKCGSVPLLWILSHPSGIERAQIPSDWVQEVVMPMTQRKEEGWYKQNSHTLETCSQVWDFSARIYIPL